MTRVISCRELQVTVDRLREMDPSKARDPLRSARLLMLEAQAQGSAAGETVGAPRDLATCTLEGALKLFNLAAAQVRASSTAVIPLADFIVLLA